MVILDNKDRVGTGIFWQYLSSIVSVLAGALFYIFIAHAFATEIVGVFALLSAIITLFITIFSIGFGAGIKRYIYFHTDEIDVARITVSI